MQFFTANWLKMSTPTSPRLQQLFQFLEASPEDAFILFAIAKEYEGLAAEEKAMEYYLRIQQNSPDYVGMYYHLGKLYVRQEAIEQALSTFEQGMEVAKSQGDRHALSELAGAKLEIED